MANLRAGLIGLGMMGRHHARVLRSLDGVELVAVADALVADVRSHDDVVRMGGEEFLVLLPGVDARRAHARLEAMRRRIADTAPVLGVADLHLSASIGLATLRPDDDEAVALLRRADEAMYRAKQDGATRCAFSRPRCRRTRAARWSWPRASSTPPRTAPRACGDNGWPSHSRRGIHARP